MRKKLFSVRPVLKESMRPIVKQTLEGSKRGLTLGWGGRECQEKSNSRFEPIGLEYNCSENKWRQERKLVLFFLKGSDKIQSYMSFKH